MNAAERFLQLAPAVADGGFAEIRAVVVGQVQYRQGDGMLHTICTGQTRIEVSSLDAVFSWVDEDHRCNAAMPFADFHRYVLEGAIRLLACGANGGHLDPISHQEQDMTQRIDYYKASREALAPMIGLEKAIEQLGLEASLLELVRLRASQINGCAYCVDYHTSQALKAGETARRLHAVVVWRESPFYTPRERAALAWTESLTLLAETNAPDKDFAPLREHFSEKEIVDLTMAVIAVNGWNRLAVGFRRSPE